jgi:murein DD-endopeptidase MepM/ murein hydrolase activator NlpD
VTAADEYNARQLDARELKPWHITELVLFWQAHHGPLVVDGQAGPATIESLDASIARRAPPPVVAPFLACPLPPLPDGRHAEVTSSFRPPDRPTHNGCDWFYRWKPGDVPNFVGDGGCEGRKPDGSPAWVVPFGVPALAAAAGTVRAAANSATGWYVWIDHGNGLRSGYFHLLDVRVRPGQHVEIGDTLGLVGHNPSDRDGRHLHFEVSPVGPYSPTDPAPYLLR